MIRDILDKNDVKIGEIEFPEGTSEEVIQAKLNEYKDPTIIISDVTPRQIRQAWILMGHELSEIDNAIAALPSPYNKLAQVEWEYSMVVKRNNPLVAMLGVAEGFSSTQLDDLWKFAYTL